MTTSKQNAPGSKEIPQNVKANDNSNKTKSAENEEIEEEWDLTEDIESNYADPSSKLRTKSKPADVIDASKHAETDKAKLRTKSKANQPQDDPAPTADRRHIVVGEYDIAISSSKVPLLGVMASSIVTLIALIVKDVNKNSKHYWRYGIVLCLVSFFVALLSLVFPSRFTNVIRPANYFIFAWNFVGACIMTFHGGPFIKTGNGYFGSWGSVIFSAMAADPPGTYTSRPLLDKMNAMLDLGAAATVVLISLADYLKNEFDKEYEGETIYALVVTILTICAVGLFSFRYWWKGSRSCFESQILITFSILWIIGSSALTFSGPFLETGNGYFASWMTAIMSFRAALYSWKHRRDED